MPPHTMDAPFDSAIRRLARPGGRFYVPGHKGNPAAIPPFGGMLCFDLTEIPGADDLTNPAGPLAESQENMARVYGSGATLYSAAGSTSCIQALLALFAGAGGHLVAARNCHVSAVHAMAFLDARPEWVLPRGGRLHPADADAALRRSGAKLLYLTSPDYYGRMSDIAALAAVCRAHGAALVVDNAHGAHLRFVRPAGGAPQSDLHPLTLGADATADSAHKTLPCLTPAALLHLRDASLAGRARRMLNLYSSTSPSYPVLQSLDLAAALLGGNTPPDFAAAAACLATAGAAAPHLVQPGDDPLKLCLLPAAGGWPAAQVEAALAAAGLVPELADGERIVLMASPWNTPDDFEALARVLSAFEQKEALETKEFLFRLLPAACSIREALFAPAERVPVQSAAGRVLAQAAAPCPPGVPVALPGEQLDDEAAAALLAGGIPAVDVVK